MEKRIEHISLTQLTYNTSVHILCDKETAVEIVNYVNKLKQENK